MLREENPGLVYCAISGYGQDGPNRDRSGHDMNYLGLNGVLGLTGEEGGPPVQSGAQIADLGGGALMAAFGVMAALHERRSSGEGQFVDISMTDGSMAWLGMLAGKFFADGSVMKRGGNELAGSIICYRPYAASDGWVTLGALEPKFWQAWCKGVDREDLIEKQFERPGSDAHKEVEQVFASRTRDEWREFASQHDCCLEPVLDLDEAFDSELTKAREMVVEVDQPGAEKPVRGIGNPVKLSRTPGEVGAPAPSLGEHTDEVLAEAGYSAEEIEALKESGAAAGLAEGAQGSVPRVSAEPESPARRPDADVRARRSLGRLCGDDQALPARGPAPRAGQDLAQHGLLPARVRRAHPPDQAAPGGALHAAEGDQGAARRGPRARPSADRARRPTARACAGRGGGARQRAPRCASRYEIPQEALDRLAELDVLTPTDEGYSPTDLRIIAAIGRFRAGGYDERIGFTVYDTLRYKKAMGELAKEEVDVLMERLAGEMDADARDRPDRVGRRAAQRADVGAAHEAARRRAREPPGLTERGLGRDALLGRRRLVVRAARTEARTCSARRAPSRGSDGVATIRTTTSSRSTSSIATWGG